MAIDSQVHAMLQRGVAIPACPLALDSERRWDQRRQRALLRYYLEAGVGGLAIGVHTTQFAIRDPRHGLFKPLLQLAAEEMQRADRRPGKPLVRIAGVCGATAHATVEAELIRELGYHAGLLSLAALPHATEDTLIDHCRAVAAILPVVGFYLQPSVGGRVLPLSFWRRFVEIENVVAIKIAPFNRYQTLDVVRAVVEAERDDVALYTGNDDNIVADLLTPFRFRTTRGLRERRIVGGLLGQWAVGTRGAVDLLEQCHRIIADSGRVADGRTVSSAEMLRLGVEVTDANAAVFDAANRFAGCIAGVHEVLRLDGLLEGIWCLDPRETLGPGQAAEIARVRREYPHLFDEAFIRENVDRWLA